MANCEFLSTFSKENQDQILSYLSDRLQAVIRLRYDLPIDEGIRAEMCFTPSELSLAEKMLRAAWGHIRRPIPGERDEEWHWVWEIEATENGDEECPLIVRPAPAGDASEAVEGLSNMAYMLLGRGCGYQDRCVLRVERVRRKFCDLMKVEDFEPSMLGEATLALGNLGDRLHEATIPESD